MSNFRKRKPKTASATRKRTLNHLCQKFHKNHRHFNLEDQQKIVELFISTSKSERLFTTQSQTYVLVASFLDMVFVTDRRFRFRSKNLGAPETPFTLSDEISVHLINFFSNGLIHRHFPLIFRSLQSLNKDERDFIDGMKAIFKKFDEKRGGVNRKIFISMLYTGGISANFWLKSVECLKDG